MRGYPVYKAELKFNYQAFNSKLYKLKIRLLWNISGYFVNQVHIISPIKLFSFYKKKQTDQDRFHTHARTHTHTRTAESTAHRESSRSSGGSSRSSR
jgi:hypothetical protein